MKKLSIVLMCALFFVATSCDKDDEMMTSGGGENPVEGAITLECSPSADLTLTNHNLEGDGVDYIIDCSTFELRDVEMTIEPGTDIQVSAGSRIIVTQDGAIIADGTSADRIRIFGEDGGTSATWSYLWINSTNVKNKLNFVNISNAGTGGTPNGNYDEISAIHLNGRLSMTNTTVNYSDGNGFTGLSLINSPNTITEFSSNIFRNCANHPVSVSPQHVGSYDFASCTYSDNGKEMIQVSGNQLIYIDTDNTWQDASIPYYVERFFRLDANLTIEAGAELIFASGAGFQNDNSVDAFMKINGTESKHVIMRGEVSVAGAWNGLRIETSSVQNVFNYLDISDGGQIPLTNISDNKGNITLDADNARLTLNNCTSTRAECDVVIRPVPSWDFFLENNSPGVTSICED